MMKLKWRKRTKIKYSHKIPIYDLYWANGKILSFSPCCGDAGPVQGRWYIEKGTYTGYYEPPQYLYLNLDWQVKEALEQHLREHVENTLDFYIQMSESLSTINKEL